MCKSEYQRNSKSKMNKVMWSSHFYGVSKLAEVLYVVMHAEDI